MQALNHLMDRGPTVGGFNEAEKDVQDIPSQSETGNAEYSTDMREFGAIGTRNASSHLASLSTMAGDAEMDVKHQGSIGRLSSIFRGDRGTTSTIKGKASSRSICESSLVTDLSRQSHEHVHDIEEEGLENVRACCGGSSLLIIANRNVGKHDVGTLSRKGKHIHK